METFREKLDSGTCQLGFYITYPAPGIIERLGKDWDWFWLDGQHGELDYNDILACIRACDHVGKSAVVRVPSQEPGWIMRALDAGAHGLIIPQVNNAEEARKVVKAAKFPPVGNRSFGGRRVVDTRGREYYTTANKDVPLIVQLETPDAVAKADEIAAVEGVDVLLAGPDDICLTQGGISLSEPKPLDKIREWHETMAAACKKHGKLLGGFGADSEWTALFMELDAAMLICGSDVGILAAGSEDVSAARHEDIGSKPSASGEQSSNTGY